MIMNNRASEDSLEKAKKVVIPIRSAAFKTRQTYLVKGIAIQIYSIIINGGYLLFLLRNKTSLNKSQHQLITISNSAFFKKDTAIFSNVAQKMICHEKSYIGAGEIKLIPI